MNGVTPQQLAQTFGIDPGRVFMMEDGESWLPSDVLSQIARQSGEFSSIEEDFDQFIAQLNQVVHVARVVDPEGRSYRRSGVATIGEKLSNGQEANPHDLASSRALVKVLDMAGFNPLKAAPVAPIKNARITMEVAAAGEASARPRDLARIHILAAEVGLIRQLTEGRNDDSKYREWLAENFGTTTAATLNEQQRASVINAFLVMKNEG
jgi:hypothetical protein